MTDEKTDEKAPSPAEVEIDPKTYNQQVCPILSLATLNSVDTSLVSVGGQATKRQSLANCLGPRCQFFMLLPSLDQQTAIVGCALAHIGRALAYNNILNSQMLANVTARQQTEFTPPSGVTN